MTVQEAIKILEQICPKRPQKLWSVKRKEAVKMAIEALQRDSCSEEPNKSDTIYRQDAIDALREEVEWEYDWKDEQWYYIEADSAIGAIERIPSANQDLSGYSDRLWKRAYDRGYERCRQDAIDALWKEPTYSDALNVLAEARDRITALPSAQLKPKTSESGSVDSEMPEIETDRTTSGDLISRQDAIYYVKQATIGETDVMKAWVKAQTHLMRLPSAQPEQECEKCIFKPFKQFQPERWIPVSETVDVPEHEVLACDKYGTELIGFICEKDEQWMCVSDECVMYDVVAWMNKPEPYER